MKDYLLDTKETCKINDKSCCCSSNKVPSQKEDLKTHWDRVYNVSDLNTLGWFEDIPTPSLHLLSKCNLDKNAAVLNLGAGTSTFVDELLKKNYKNVIVNDFSAVALTKLKNRLSDKHQKYVRWIQDDLTNSSELTRLEPIDLWHDRAVLHFFNDAKDQDAYFNLLRSLVKVHGYVILAEFSLEGAAECSGLPVFRYSEKMFEEKLGSDFNLIENFNFTYHMPSGQPREYVYALFKRINK